MLADSVFGFAAAFPLPHLPPVEPDFIPAVLPSPSAIKLAIRNLFTLVHFGAAGLSIADNLGCHHTILIDKSRGEAQFGSRWENSF